MFLAQSKIVKIPFVIPVFVCSLIGFATLPQPVAADWKDDVGFTRLINEVGGALPDGSGVVVSQVEAPNGAGNYFPDLSNADFIGKSFIDGSGGGTGTSAHSNFVGALFYGNNGSMVPGVTDITMYEVNHWMSSVINVFGNDPLAQNFSVQNHSWIGNYATTAQNVEALRRLDFVADQSEVTMVVGLNNNDPPIDPNKSHPRLLSHMFNAIAVGVTNSEHSRGNTLIYTPGRIRPDIVAPGGSTSSGTPMVGSGAALLHAQADTIADATARMNAKRTETIRAIMMAGASKSEFADWDRTTTRPLDDIFGAGELDVYNNYQIMNAGEFDGTTTEPVIAAAENGYDYVSSLDPADELYFNFEVAAGAPVQELSVILTWNMEITDGDPGAAFDPSENIANMNLQFYDSTNSFMDTLLDESISSVDNREHIYQTNLGPGTYTVVVSTDRDQDFSVAWRSIVIPEPSSLAILGLIGLGLACRRQRRPL